ncbi:hypothetical protein ACIRU8_44200 [Streptomyces sp. NPDC101175]|uniref:hypothetical protein n=1 Tax=Streptomyces sp. NPDC101175 TaxID=3366123 RepID=UPI0038391536
MGDELFDPDGNSLPAPEAASFDLLIRTLGLFSSLADEMDREPHSFTIHGDVLLAQFGRVADVAQWVGLAATALRRELLEDLGRVPAAGEPSAESASEGLRRFRVVAVPNQAEYPGASSLTHFAYARSVEEAVAEVRAAHERPGGVYGDKGLYRVVEVTEEGPSGEARQQEAARRLFVTTVMLAARAEASQEITHLPHPEMFGILCDFFTRAIVFPGKFGFPSGTAADDTQLHTSDPARALSRLLLEHLTHHALDLVEADDRAPSYLPETEGRHLEARDDEDDQAPAELIGQVLAICEQHYAAVTGTSPEQWDRESAREVVDAALRTVRPADHASYPQALEAYLHEHRARLERLWRRYRPGGMFAGELTLIDLPGCFVLCERIDNSPLWLEGVWAREGQEENALERLQNAWRYDTGEESGR